MTKLPETLNRDAVEIFATIMRYMGDSGKKPSPKQEVEYLFRPPPPPLKYLSHNTARIYLPLDKYHAQLMSHSSFSCLTFVIFDRGRYVHFIASKAIATEALRDEIFCGLIRQVNKNPKE